MIDLHTHTIFSDGELIPYELVRRAEAIGYQAIAITDHVDFSNIDFVVPSIVKAVKKLKGHAALEVIPGAEITHCPPGLISELVREARALGAKIVVVHGETIVEPVLEGTNRAAIEAGADPRPPGSDLRRGCASCKRDRSYARNHHSQGTFPFQRTCRQGGNEIGCRPIDQ